MRTRVLTGPARFVRLLLVTVVAVGGLLGLAAARAANAALPNQWAYLWANQPTVASYDVNNNGFSASSSGGEMHITRQGTGQYLVTLAGITGTGGTVDITGSDTHNPANCQNAGFEPSGSSENILVLCFDGNGAPADYQFYLAYTHTHSASGKFAYGAYTAGGTSTKPYTFSTGGKVSVKRVNTGVFQVDLAGLATPGGTVMTTPIGTAARVCSPVSWHPAGKAERIFISCTTANGAVTDDVGFLFTFADHQGLLGNKTFRGRLHLGEQAQRPLVYRAEGVHVHVRRVRAGADHS